jgi:hypothetical protein
VRDQKIKLYRDQDRDQKKNFSGTRTGTEKKLPGLGPGPEPKKVGPAHLYSKIIFPKKSQRIEF